MVVHPFIITRSFPPLVVKHYARSGKQVWRSHVVLATNFRWTSLYHIPGHQLVAVITTADGQHVISVVVRRRFVSRVVSSSRPTDYVMLSFSLFILHADIIEEENERS